MLPTFGSLEGGPPTSNLGWEGVSNSVVKAPVRGS
jgi:hypothetical protein